MCKKAKQELTRSAKVNFLGCVGCVGFRVHLFPNSAQCYTYAKHKHCDLHIVNNLIFTYFASLTASISYDSWNTVTRSSVRLPQDYDFVHRRENNLLRRSFFVMVLTVLFSIFNHNIATLTVT